MIVKEQKHANVTDSMLVRFMLHKIDSASAQLYARQGFRVRSPNGEVLHVKARVKLTVGDWEEHVKTFNLVGYNGTVPCGICENVTGRCAPFEHETLLHISTHDRHKLDRNTPESFRELAGKVEVVPIEHGETSK